MSRGAEPREAKLHEAQASQPWILVAFGPCGTRAVFAATKVAAHAGVKAHVTHSAINIILLLQNVRSLRLSGKRAYSSGRAHSSPASGTGSFLLRMCWQVMTKPMQAKPIRSVMRPG